MGCCRRGQDHPEDEDRGGCRCCCCGRRGATILFALLGLAFAGAIIAGPVYVYNDDQDYAKLFPIFHYGREYLHQVTGEPVMIRHESGKKPAARGGGGGFEAGTGSDVDAGGSAVVTDEYETDDTEMAKLISAKARKSSSSEQTYRLAIFQLLDDAEGLSPYLAFFCFCIGCINVPINLLMLFAASFRFRCGLIPWLALVMLEHIIIGIPLIVFFGLISLYLAAQIGLYVVASALFGIVMASFFISLSTWFTVYATYSYLGRYVGYDYGNCDSQVAQPLLSSSSMNGGPPPLPPGHPAHYQPQQQFYPPHSQGRQLPSAPPHGGGGIYPQLPMA